MKRIIYEISIENKPSKAKPSRMKSRKKNPKLEKFSFQFSFIECFASSLYVRVICLVCIYAVKTLFETFMIKDKWIKEKIKISSSCVERKTMFTRSVFETFLHLSSFRSFSSFFFWAHLCHTVHFFSHSQSHSQRDIIKPYMLRDFLWAAFRRWLCREWRKVFDLMCALFQRDGLNVFKFTSATVLHEAFQCRLSKGKRQKKTQKEDSVGNLEGNEKSVNFSPEGVDFIVWNLSLKPSNAFAMNIFYLTTIYLCLSSLIPPHLKRMNEFMKISNISPRFSRLSCRFC